MTDPVLHGLFHTLWTKAVHQEGYVKSEWMALERKLKNMEKELVDMAVKNVDRRIAERRERDKRRS